MMVIFVSQCEKKALNRTRRVLDAFANRIGCSTWKTIITEEGLEAVKKLLRKTATKSTAVSCHLIRGRSRTDFIWSVGNKNAFNEKGYVPVNFTTKDVLIGDRMIERNKFYANKQFQPLAEHLFAVGYLAYRILSSKLDINYLAYAESAFIAGCFHDIGKIDPAFQTWLKKEGSDSNQEEVKISEDGVHIEKVIKKKFFDSHPRHNEISHLLLNMFFSSKSIDGMRNTKQLENVKHAVYWHHAKPFREEQSQFCTEYDVYKKLLKSLPNEDIKLLYKEALEVIGGVAALLEKYELELRIPKCSAKLDEDYSPEKRELPNYKEYDRIDIDLKDIKRNVTDNARKSAIRAALISADRLVSSLSAEELTNLIKNKMLDTLFDESYENKSNLKNGIEKCLSNFNLISESKYRNESQSEAATSLAEVEGIAVLNGPAGCGKTKIALEWALKTNAKKIIWVCPRVQVCQGIMYDLSSQEYLSNNRIEIYSGDIKQTWIDNQFTETSDFDAFSGEIVITTIDQISNSITTHSKITTLIDFFDAHVVFDEFHEFINMPAYNLLFSELIELKKMRGQFCQTLLVSATPNYYFVEKFLELNKNSIKGIKSFNESKYFINLENYDDISGEISPILNNFYSDNTIVITNTAKNAQCGFIRNMEKENSILFHSKFSKKDKIDLFGQVFDSFKKNGTKQFDVLRSGPIVQASLNITCKRMITEFTSPENWLQRLGRLDRFGENDNANVYTTIIEKSIIQKKRQSKNARFLKGVNSLESSFAWLDFLIERDLNNKEFGINDLYQFYKDFYESEKYIKYIEQDLLSALRLSIQIINDKITDPIKVPTKKFNLKNSSIKIKKQSLRGDSRFVQMAYCHITSNGEINILNEYLFAKNSDSEMTLSIEEIKGYGDSERNLVSYMKAKHHNINKEYVKAYKDIQLIDAARSASDPIYLSYTPVDLENVGGLSVAHQYAIYYAISDRQAIGAISKIN